MFSSSSWLHLRIPFSYFLLPVFLFSLSVSPNITEKNLLWTFLIIHFLLYPASNGYNSYFDKDEKSIGGLKNPPPVNRGLFFLSLAFDTIAIALGLIQLSLSFSIMLLVYGLVSKAYSHPSIRLKKYPIAGWIIVSLFQGLFTFMMCYVGVSGLPIELSFRSSVLIPGMLATLLLLGTYPMTQIYQHEEDGKRGDQTFSRMLGIRGTFYFVGAIFAFVSASFVYYFYTTFSLHYALVFLAAMSPVVTFFFIWFIKVLKDETKANHTNTMWLNFISATCLNAFFIYLFLDSSHILQARG